MDSAASVHPTRTHIHLSLASVRQVGDSSPHRRGVGALRGPGSSESGSTPRSGDDAVNARAALLRQRSIETQPAVSAGRALLISRLDRDHDRRQPILVTTCASALRRVRREYRPIAAATTNSSQASGDQHRRPSPPFPKRSATRRRTSAPSPRENGRYHVGASVADAYRDLLVRVAGYSDYFVDLGRDVQEEIIARTAQGEV